MDRIERVRRAIRGTGPDRAPILFFNGDRTDSDIILIDVVRHFMGANKDRSEWGFSWQKRDETMGQAGEPPIESWDDLASLEVPPAFDPARFDDVAPTRERYGPDRYYLASLVLTGFTIMTFLRGFENLLVDLVENPPELDTLADQVFGFEEDVIRQLAAYGFHGVAFYDDWGTQKSLTISPRMWRSFFKPRYRQQFALAHSLGLDVYFHSCGCISAIVPDLIEIGVDMLNLSQPNVLDVETIGREHAGRVCFVCPISYQTTSISGTRQDIFREAKRLLDHLGRPNGGFIGYVEEYQSMGMSDDNYRACIAAFQELGTYESPAVATGHGAY